MATPSPIPLSTNAVNDKVTSSIPQRPLTAADIDDATEKLTKAAMFHRCDESDLRRFAKTMHKVVFSRGDLIATQNQNADRFFVIADGYVRRLRLGSDGVERQVDMRTCGTTISATLVTSGDPIYATAKCVTQTCTAYAMSRAAFRAQLTQNPAFSMQVIESLSETTRQAKLFRTPLLSQKTSQELNFSGVAVAATAESYYRSALNSLLNQRLSGIKSPLFPNMHVQVPARIAYITGFKGLRALLDREIDPDKWETHPSRVAVRFTTIIAPGILMTPVSSVLEACNVGHVNSEPLWQRSMRGTVPRGGREIIFGVGLNQLSDYFEERYRTFTSAVIANTAGSLTAGVISGYFSHVPHNISTYKLLNPTKGYKELFNMFVEKSVPDKLIPKGLSPPVLNVLKPVLACLFPRGVMVRTVQICGSFAILNSVIQLVERDNRRRMRNVLNAASGEATAEEGVTIATPSVDVTPAK